MTKQVNLPWYKLSAEAYGRADKVIEPGYVIMAYLGLSGSIL
jgi:hypothetical protein